ncbi:MAG: hypothetical protein Q8R15_04910 [Candidatus Micrarchaeota archaeon]|nr:hypothetical protein [Candidatus Micrarchaeota archaeon]
MQDVHHLVEIGLRENNLLSPVEWRQSKSLIRGRLPGTIYTEISRTKVGGVSFCGHGSWAAYLKNHHAVDVPLHKLTYSDAKLHELIGGVIQATGLTAAKHWSSDKITKQKDDEREQTLRDLYDSRVVFAPINHKKMRALHALASERKVDGKPFFGHGTWEAYLEAVQGVVPLDGLHWSDERFHRSIAVMAKKKNRRVGWISDSPVIHGKSLKDLYEQAWRSNQSKKSPHGKLFGHKTFKDYVAWAVEHYGDVAK